MPKPVTINLSEVEQNPERAAIKYGNKDVVSKMYSVSRTTVTKWIADMRDNPKFADGVVNPTHKIVLIKLDRFEDYFRWLEDNRYRR
ncbi:Hypothetical protein Tpal_472 [Trichococcus palustris]|uniref:Uncharacterized protein n=1 Tax=Trichococcus palustris TaxID=140314 RepID=A0A143Y7A5_9LACT|nr:excisionase [Trichococcus palustris]CZQ83660.1 Hypothetical protein Tpal_472 [Trichococcus palustris]SFK70311.1 hypothetical protein SAMN04488076_103182 [Trichococcus palustris]